VGARLIAPTLRDYQGSWLVPDVLAGMTLVAIAVPEQMATARLANMPAVAGLYAFIAGSLMFALLGLNRRLSVGADSTIAPVLAVGVAAVAAAGSPRYVDLVSFLALMVGALVMAIGLLRLGWIASFLSTPVITGVLAGIAVEIVVRQLPAVLGVSGGETTTVGRVRSAMDQIGHANVGSVLIAVGVFAVIVLAEHVDRRIPGALIGLVGSILASSAFALKAHGVRVLGLIHGGLPAFGVPSASWADTRRLIAPALTIGFVCVAQTAATLRASSAGDQGTDPVTDDFNRDLVALGAGSVVSGLSGSFAVNSSPPRTAVVTAAGARSQLTSVVAALVGLAVVLLATGLFKDLPQATLGAILLFVATRLFRVRELRSILQFDRLEFGLAVVTGLAVSFFGIEQGVLVAILLSLADRTRRAARPRDVLLGRVPGTPHWIPLDVGHPTEQVPGVIAYLLYAPIWYGNADHVRARIREILDAATEPVHAFVLDADAVADIDYTGARMLGELTAELRQRGVQIGVARCSHLVHHDLKHSGIMTTIGPDHLYLTVESAVEALALEE
jgi:sulfate permease, SulP family